MVDEQLTPQEEDQLKALLGYGAASPEGKHNVHTFLHSVATADDTTKLGYLDKDEVGTVENPIRAYKFLSLFAKDIMKKPGLAEFFAIRSEIITSTSLSKDAMLLRTAVTTKRELADVSKKGQQGKSSWFGKKNKDEGAAEPP